MSTKRSPSATDGTMDRMLDTLVDRVHRSFTIGTDAEGKDHHYYRPADTVVVYDADGVHHRQRLDGRPITEWVEFVDDERGWLSMGEFAAVGLREDRRRKGEA